MPPLVKSNMAEDFSLVVMRAFGVSLSPTSTGLDAEPAEEPETANDNITQVLVASISV